MPKIHSRILHRFYTDTDESTNDSIGSIANNLVDTRVFLTERSAFGQERTFSIIMWSGGLKVLASMVRLTRTSMCSGYAQLKLSKFIPDELVTRTSMCSGYAQLKLSKFIPDELVTRPSLIYTFYNLKLLPSPAVLFYLLGRDSPDIAIYSTFQFL